MYKKQYMELRDLMDQGGIALLGKGRELSQQRSIMTKKAKAGIQQVSSEMDEDKRKMAEALAQRFEEANKAVKLGEEEVAKLMPAVEEEVVDMSPSAEAPERQQVTGELPKGANKLLQDDAFMNQLALMQNKYPGLTQQEIFDVIQGESSFRLGVVNSGGYKGLFQIGEAAAGDAGIDYDNLEKMSAADQLKAYDKYLDFWGYDGTYALGILQAAPKYRNASPDTVVYTKKDNPKVFELNEKWFDENGNATVASINSYYGY
jgi:hypothetical protein